jgi:hypothetical protein
MNKKQVVHEIARLTASIVELSKTRKDLETLFLSMTELGEIVDAPRATATHASTNTYVYSNEVKKANTKVDDLRAIERNNGLALYVPKDVVKMVIK